MKLYMNKTIEPATTLKTGPARRSAENFTRLSLYGVILKYTTVRNPFFQCHSYRASDELNKSRIITAQQPGL